MERKNLKKFRDKSDLQTLPDIPIHFMETLKRLFHDLQFTNESKLRKLEKIYVFLDEFGKFVSEFSVCSKGCAYCCYIAVSVTDLEAAFIEEQIGRKRKLPEGMPSVNSSQKCPFLNKNSECAIYHCRPVHCRTFHTLDDPKYCRTGEDHQVYGSWAGQYTVGLYKKLNEVLNYFNQNRPSYDIRDFFG